MTEPTSLRSLRLPLTDDQLRPLAPVETRVQFSSLPADDDLRRIARLLEPRPDAVLRVYGGYDGSIRDLEFLRLVPGVRHVSVDALPDLASFDGLRHLSPELETLGIGDTKRRLSIGGIERFTGLTSLFVEGQHADLDVIGRLTTLEQLTLRSVTLPDLSLLLPLERLRSLALKLGGTRDLALLPRVGRIESLELWLIRGLADVSVVAQLPGLQRLFLQALKQVTALPSFAGSPALARVALETMRGLTDLAPLAEAPALAVLNLIDFGHADPSIVRPFVGHPTLRGAIWAFGSKPKNDAASAILPLPRESFA